MARFDAITSWLAPAWKASSCAAGSVDSVQAITSLRTSLYTASEQEAQPSQRDRATL